MEKNFLGYLIFSVISAICVLFIVAILADLETTKQRTIMMKACVENGGNWSLTWNNRPVCEKK